MMPQQTTALLFAWIAQLWLPKKPAEIAVAEPAVPSTEGGGVDAASLPPQQTTAPVPAWIAHAWKKLVETAVAEPAVPSTEDGGLACPELSSPQQVIAPVPAWIAQL
jgi:hypothetical protein